MAFLHTLGTLGLLHTFITILYYFLLACFIGRVILSWLAMVIPSLTPGHPIVRTVNNITGPLYDPLYRLVPGSASIGALDMRSAIALIFSWWGLFVLTTLMSGAIPYGW
jgi:uncharacterized protein YggT (Ycf19 family)